MGSEQTIIFKNEPAIVMSILDFTCNSFKEFFDSLKGNTQDWHLLAAKISPIPDSSPSQYYHLWHEKNSCEDNSKHGFLNVDLKVKISLLIFKS